MQHKALKLMASKLAVAGIIEGGFSEEGLAAMSQCDDMASAMAKELTLGIRDSVEDVSAAFRRMARRRQGTATQRLTVFSDSPVEIAPEPRTDRQTIEFTYAAPDTAPASAPAIEFADMFAPEPKALKKIQPMDMGQLSFFEVA